MKNENKEPLEKDIQREICEYLHSKGIFFWRQNNIPVFGRSNDGQKRFRALPKFTPRGIPDIIALTRGVFIGLEVKRPNSPSKTGNDQQVAFGKRILENGGKYFIVFSLDDVKKIPELELNDLL